MARQEEQPLALVTGAAQGIGEAVVERLLEDGLRVLALDRDAAGLQTLSRRLSAQPVSTVEFNLTLVAETPAFLQGLVAEHGPITRLALIAGVWPGAPIVEMTDETWDLNFRVNVTSPFAFMRSLAPVMATAGGGAIVATASRNAYRSSVDNAAYDASKAALLGLMRTASGEFAGYGIRVNAVSPGVISTPGTREIEDPSFKGPYLKQIPMDRYGSPRDRRGLLLPALGRRLLHDRPGHHRRRGADRLPGQRAPPADPGDGCRRWTGRRFSGVGWPHSPRA